MKRYTNSKFYEDAFWDMYFNADEKSAKAIEDVVEELGLSDEVFLQDPDVEEGKATEEDYKRIINTFDSSSSHEEDNSDVSKTCKLLSSNGYKEERLSLEEDVRLFTKDDSKVLVCNSETMNHVLNNLYY